MDRFYAGARAASSPQKQEKVVRSATATLGFPSDHDTRGTLDSSGSGSETDSLADRAAARLRAEAPPAALASYGSQNMTVSPVNLIYSKNNVCVHGTSSATPSGSGKPDTVHVPGYLTLSCRGQSILGVGSSLILHWVPNTYLTGPQYGLHDGSEPQLSANHLDPARDRSSSGIIVPQDPLPRDVSTFTIDIGRMRSLRLFHNQDDRASGQLVITSMSKQFRVLHFHHGGLLNLLKAFQDWPMCSQTSRRDESIELPRNVTFNICRTHLDDECCHPEEGMYCALTPDAWFGFMGEDGRVSNEQLIRKIIFFGGITPEARRLVWPFLLNYFSFGSTHEERAAIRDDYRRLYDSLNKKQEAMDSAERKEFWRKVQCTVEKDVVRTDRSQPFYAGDNNPNVATLQEILLCYAMLEPEIGYTQGMSDLLAPLLAAVQDRVDAFACFIGLMRFSVLMSTSHSSMHRQLDLMREMMVVQLPAFYSFLAKSPGGTDLLFCHRWLLLSFKREFAHAEALRVWEACWSSQPHFPFTAFLCLAIFAVYGGEVVERKLPVDEMLLYFSKLAHQMSVEVVLHQARALVYQLAALTPIPCRIAALLPQLRTNAFELSGVKKTFRFSCEECVGSELCPRRYSSNS